jgi:hypothetical protein
MKRKCAGGHGFLDHYSFGVRWEVYSRHHAEPGFHLRATDLLPGPPHADLDRETRGSVFCLCPSGTGWGMRVFHAIALGCVPLIIQRDDKGAYPPVLQAFEGPLLDWDGIGLRLEPRHVPQLPAILRSYASNTSALMAKRREMARMWTRLLWREAMPDEVAKLLADAPDAFDSLIHTLRLRMRQKGVASARRRGRDGHGDGAAVPR